MNNRSRGSIPPIRFILLLFLFSLSSKKGFSQYQHLKNSEAPQTIKVAFNSRYPEYKAVGYFYLPSDSTFKIIFQKKMIEWETIMTSDGGWIQTRTLIDKRTIPATIQEAFNSSEYSDWAIKETYRVETAEVKGGCQYVVAKDKEIYWLIFDLEGKLVRKIKKA